MYRRSFLMSLAAGPLVTGLPALAQEVEPLPDNMLGNPDATVEVIEYASFSCIHCANFHSQDFPELKANYIETDKIRFVYREVYFNKFDLWAGMLARCAGAGQESEVAAPGRAYFAFVDLLFKERDTWLKNESDDIVAGLYSLGRQAGMTDEAMTACLQDPAMAEALVQDYQLKAGQHEVRSTPTFVVDGEVHKNMPYDEFAELLDGKLN